MVEDFTHEGCHKVWGESKLNPRNIGPLKIVERVEKMTYKLALSPSLPSMHPMFHVSILQC